MLVFPHGFVQIVIDSSENCIRYGSNGQCLHYVMRAIFFAGLVLPHGFVQFMVDSKVMIYPVV